MAGAQQQTGTYSGYGEWLGHDELPHAMIKDHSFAGLLGQIKSGGGLEQLAALTVMRMNFFNSEWKDCGNEKDLLKILVSFLPAQGKDDIGRHCAMNSYWIISHMTTGSDASILHAVFADELNVLVPINIDLCGDDFEAIEMIGWLLANAANPYQNILKLIISQTKIVQIIEKLTYHLSS